MNRINWGQILGIIIIVALLAVPFVLPIFQLTSDIKTVLTVISLLFAILTGFFIGAASANYLRLQTLIANANAGLISMFNLAKLIQISSAPKVANAIDQYMIAVLDYELLEYSPATQKEFDKLVKVIDEITPDEDKSTKTLLSELHKIKNNLIAMNYEVSLTTKRIVTPKHWFILILLASLIVLMILSLRDGQWIFSLINGIILVAIYQILKLLYAIDTNLFLAQKLAYEVPQQIFQAIGKLKYYPKTALTERRIKMLKENYRVGVYKNYPTSFDKEIKTVKKH